VKVVLDPMVPRGRNGQGRFYSFFLYSVFFLEVLKIVARKI